MPGLLEKSRLICDCVHGLIDISYYANLLIDTKYFARTSKILQVGIVKQVYPGAEHSRKPHMLGSYYLAVQYLTKLRENQPELDITDKDILCVSIAGLLHDIGHGLASHTYEYFLNVIDKDNTFRHEEASIRLIQLIFKNYPDIKRQFDEIFDVEDYIFINECIDPPETFIKNNNWELKGRPIEKSFLYDIVSNNHTGLDVDKFDYLLRDALMAGIDSKHFSKDNIARIFENTRAIRDPKLQYLRLCYAEKVQADLEGVYDARRKMHTIMYKHKTCLSYEKVFVDALILANDHLKFFNEKGEAFKLSELYKDWELYSKITEEVVLSQITMSISPELEESRNILDELSNRHLPKRISKLNGSNLINYSESEIEEIIKTNCKVKTTKDNFFVKIRHLHGGKGLTKNPNANILLYDKDYQFIKSRDPYNQTQLPGGFIDAHVFVAYNLDTTIKEALKESAEAFSNQIYESIN
uniref:HD domain-containing protein n=1 Tax=Rhabditophanes sp. KR3021 TaxID=114890 RepID=A0AC35TGV3_9BILA